MPRQETLTIATCKQFDLEALGLGPIMPEISPDYTGHLAYTMLLKLTCREDA